MMTYLTKFPEHVPTSQYLIDNADGCFSIDLYGQPYYIPVTKELKKIFGLKKRGDKMIFASSKDDMMIEEILRLVIDATYIQIRDTVGSEISQEITKIVTNKIANLLAPQLDREITKRFEKKFLIVSEDKGLKPEELD
jgi:hypothetical protein